MEQQMLSAQRTLIIPKIRLLVDKVEYQELKNQKRDYLELNARIL